MGKYESLCNFEKNQRLAIYGQEKQAEEDAYRSGYRQALDDVRVILGGVSPVSPAAYPEEARLIDKIDLTIMQDLYAQVDSIREYMELRAEKQLTATSE